MSYTYILFITKGLGYDMLLYDRQSKCSSDKMFMVLFYYLILKNEKNEEWKILKLFNIGNLGTAHDVL